MAVQAHLDLEARISVGMHFGTFELTDEGIDEPERELRRMLLERDLVDRFRVPLRWRDAGPSSRIRRLRQPESAHVDHRRGTAADPAER